MSGAGTTYFTGQLQDIAVQAANAYGVPENLFNQLITTESNFVPAAVSSAGAVGLGQLLPSTASNLTYNGASVNPYDPVQNLYGSAEYLKQLYDQFGSWEAAANAYNVGPGAYAQGSRAGVTYAPVISAAQQADENAANNSSFGFSISPDQSSQDQFYLPGTDSGIAGGDTIGDFSIDGTSTAAQPLPGVLGDIGGQTTQGGATGISGALGNIGDTLTSLKNAITGNGSDGISGALSLITSSDVWKRFGVFIIAAVLILSAFLIYAMQSRSTQTVIKEAVT